MLPLTWLARIAVRPSTVPTEIRDEPQLGLVLLRRDEFPKRAR